jgi:hypothetical protein
VRREETAIINRQVGETAAKRSAFRGVRVPTLLCIAVGGEDEAHRRHLCAPHQVGGDLVGAADGVVSFLLLERNTLG